MNIQINRHFQEMKQNYLFSEIGARVRAYSAKNPEAKIIRLGIGDVTLPLTPSVVAAMKNAADEMGAASSFRGYAPEAGYDFLREAVAAYYRRQGVTLDVSEIFISDGAKSDIGNLTDLFGDNLVRIPDPVYPAYLDSNLISGRRVSFMNATEENGFLPMPDDLDDTPAVIYLCSPNNPTGAVYNRDGLTSWVDYANKTGSLIIFDSAYEAYIPKERRDVPRSIFEIPGARTCAVEVCSLSKTAGFTGTRCAWTIIPTELAVDGISLRNMWDRRQATKFNGVPYVVQRAAEAALSERGMNESAACVAYYMENARMLADLLREKNIWFTGGECSPYLWLACPNKMKSWDFFDLLLTKFHIVGTPGAGFGQQGEGFFRLTSFGSREATAEAVERLRRGL